MSAVLGVVGQRRGHACAQVVLAAAPSLLPCFPLQVLGLVWDVKVEKQQRSFARSFAETYLWAKCVQS